MSLDHSRADLSDYSEPQDFVDHCSYGGLVHLRDVARTHTLHVGSTGMNVVLDQTRPYNFGRTGIGVAERRRIIVADAALNNVDVIDILCVPLGQRVGRLLRYVINGLDSEHPRVEKLEAVFGKSDVFVQPVPPRGIVKVVTNNWYRDGNVRGMVRQFDEDQWAQYMLAHRVGQAIRDAQ